FAGGAARFRRLLRGVGIVVPFRALLRAYLVGAFFNVALPGGLAGDAWRILDVRRGTGRGSEALGVVAVERLVSLAALVLVALTAVSLVPLHAEQAWARTTIVAAGAACLAGGLLARRPGGVGPPRGPAAPVAVPPGG